MWYKWLSINISYYGLSPAPTFGRKNYQLYFFSCYNKIMNGLTINIGWEWFLGIIGALIGIAWYSSGRFTALETSMKWLKETIVKFESRMDKFELNYDNKNMPAFETHSPINLNERGQKWLIEAGIKEYVDSHKNEFMKICEGQEKNNPYDVQEHIFTAFNTLALEPAFEDKLKRFAFEKGTSVGILRRVAAIYFRNLCLGEFGMNEADIDKHDPRNGSTNL